MQHQVQKALVVGGGSIGARHLRNLRALGIPSLGVVEPVDARRETLAGECSARAFSSLEEGLSWRPDAAVIATPTQLHARQALQVARAGVPLFVEKPLSHNLLGITDLLAEIARRNLVSLAGCNLRFHPGPAKVKELLGQERIGRILFARVHTGSYLPEWRPAQDYRESYSASPDAGGCILDCIHEIDLARWYLGEVAEVTALAAHLSNLEVGAEDVAAMLFRHVSGAISEVHLDFVQRTYERGCQIVGERGSIFWDFGAGRVRLCEATKPDTIFAQPQDWSVNCMYLDEMRHFLDCVSTGKPTVLPVAEGARVLRIALAAKESRGNLIRLSGEAASA